MLAWDRTSRPVEGCVEDIAMIVASVSHALTMIPAVIIPGKDAARSAAEEGAGRALGAVLRAVPSAIAFARGRAVERGERFALLVDVESEALRALPWELVGEDAPIEATGGLVARLGEGVYTPRAAASDLRVARWCPTPDDPACCALLERQDRALARMGLPGALTVTPSAPPTEVTVLHVVCHGVRDGDAVTLALGDDDQAHSSAAHALATHLKAARLVILDVCDSGDDTPRALDNLAVRVVACGAEACLAPAGPASVEAAATLAEGVWTALAAGDDLASAIARGRRAVRALGIPHPDSRWFNHRLIVVSGEVLEAPPPVQPTWRPAGLARPSPEAASLLETARTLATELGGGYVGVEHLALALERWGGGGVRTRSLRFLCPYAELRAIIGAFTPTEASSQDDKGTSRFRRVALSDGFSADELWASLLDDPGLVLHDLGKFGEIARAAAPTGLSTLMSFHDGLVDEEVARPAVRLEVVGGPEDGRWFEPHAGETIGRWGDASPPTHALYADTAVTDRRLSRQHLRWEGAGRVFCFKKVWRRRAGRAEAFEGEVILLEGDVLVLSPGTRVRGV